MELVLGLATTLRKFEYTWFLLIDVFPKMVFGFLFVCLSCHPFCLVLCLESVALGSVRTFFLASTFWRVQYQYTPGEQPAGCESQNLFFVQQFQLSGEFVISPNC